MAKTLGTRLHWHAAGLLAAALTAFGSGCGKGKDDAAARRVPDPAPPSATSSPAGADPHASVPSLPAGHPAIGGTPPAAGEAVTGTVEIAPALRARQDTPAILFVVARRAGSREIVAVTREENARLPYSFELSGRDSMTGDVPFSGVLDITARLSRSGDALPVSGDLEGVVRNVAVGQRGVKVVIDTTRP